MLMEMDNASAAGPSLLCMIISHLFHHHHAHMCFLVFVFLRSNYLCLYRSASSMQLDGIMTG